MAFRALMSEESTTSSFDRDMKPMVICSGGNGVLTGAFGRTESGLTSAPDLMRSGVRTSPFLPPASLREE